MFTISIYGSKVTQKVLIDRTQSAPFVWRVYNDLTARFHTPSIMKFNLYWGWFGMMNGMFVEQNGQYYSVYTPNGIMVAQIFMGNDGQFLLDAKCMEVITKLMARRWRISNKKWEQLKGCRLKWACTSFGVYGEHDFFNMKRTCWDFSWYLVCCPISSKIADFWGCLLTGWKSWTDMSCSKKVKKCIWEQFR